MGQGSMGLSGLTEFEAQNAFEQALINQGVGGGGGLTFPDSITTGTGVLVIPAGFNAIVRVVADPENPFSINGTTVLGFNQGGPSRFGAQFDAGPAVGFDFATLPDGPWMVAYTAGPAGQNTQILFQPDNAVFGPYAQGQLYKGSNQLVNNFDLDNVPGGSLNTSQMGGYARVHGPVKLFPSATSTEFVYYAVRDDINNAVSQTFFVPEGDTINGGTARAVELYAI